MNVVSKHDGLIGRIAQGYSDEPRPLKAYVGLMGIFNLIFAAVLLVAKRGNRHLRDRIGYADVISLGIATHKVSRMLAKD